ncbi:hypothetical protein BH23BAC1_BH23BAC1_33790 [soil metagenome]
MRTSLNEIKIIEDYLFQKIKEEDQLLFHAKLVLENDLKQKMLYQEKAYEVIKIFGRKKLKKEIASVEKKLFSQTKYTSFRNKILGIFNN